MEYLEFMRHIEECTGRDTWDVRLEICPRTQDCLRLNEYYDDLISIIAELLSKEEGS